MIRQKSFRFSTLVHQPVLPLSCQTANSKNVVTDSSKMKISSVTVSNVKKRDISSASSFRFARTKSSTTPNFHSRPALRYSGSTTQRNKVYLDRPEIIKDKAKKLVLELLKKNIKLKEQSIEKLILGEPMEYIQVLKRLLLASGWMTRCNEQEQPHKTLSFSETVKKLDGAMKEAVTALFRILNHFFDCKPTINAVQFLQKRFTVQKMSLCLEVLSKLSPRP